MYVNYRAIFVKMLKLFVSNNIIFKSFKTLGFIATKLNWLPVIFFGTVQIFYITIRTKVNTRKSTGGRRTDRFLCSTYTVCNSKVLSSVSRLPWVARLGQVSSYYHHSQAEACEANLILEVVQLTGGLYSFISYTILASAAEPLTLSFNIYTMFKSRTLVI